MLIVEAHHWGSPCTIDLRGKPFQEVDVLAVFALLWYSDTGVEIPQYTSNLLLENNINIRCRSEALTLAFAPFNCDQTCGYSNISQLTTNDQQHGTIQM